mgnify:FL=1
MFSKTPQAFEELSNYATMKELNSTSKYQFKLDVINQIAKKSGIKNGDMRDFFDHFNNMYNGKGEKYYFMYLRFFDVKDLKPTYNIAEEIKTAENKYPMVFAIINLASQYDINPYIKDIDNYIKLVDGV